jgi:hypothetical protein
MGHTPDRKAGDNSDTNVATAIKERPGRVEVDSRGRNVWRWNSNGENESTSVLLKRLDNEELALEPTQKVPLMKKPVAGTAAAVKQAAGGARTAPSAANPRAKSSAPGDDAKAAKAAKRNRPAFAVERSDPKKRGGFDPYNSR